MPAQREEAKAEEKAEAKGLKEAKAEAKGVARVEQIHATGALLIPVATLVLGWAESFTAA
jgi:hypothetical protein